ncbi:MAG: GIY-YIG nuclease family protein [Clostridium sp.]
MIIYKVTNLINNKIYIGQTIHPLAIRKSQHERSHLYGYKTTFSNAINKYGIDNFHWEVIYTATTIDELNEKESFFISFYQSLTTQNGYNLKGGGGNSFLTQEVKDKISISQKGSLNHMFGKTGDLNKTSKRTINLTTGRIFGSASVAAKYDNVNFSHVCSVCRGTRASTNGFIYRYLDDDGNIIPPLFKSKVKNRKVRNIDTNEIFDNATLAEKHYQGYKSGNLTKACKGINKTFANFHWEYYQP